MKIGIDIGGSHICIGLINNKKIIDTVYFQINLDEIENIEMYIIENCIDGIKKLMVRKDITEEKISKIGIACPGKVKDNIAYDLYNLNIKKFDIVKQLRKVFNTNIIVNNDADCAGYAEKILGSMKEYSDYVFLCLGTGIGGTIISDNKVLTDKKNTTCEFGHMIINKNGEQCNCGNKGCFERYASMRRFKKNVKDYLHIPKELEGEELYNVIHNAYITGKISHIVEEYIDNLAFGISNLINIFNPQAICIGGGFVYYEEILLDNLVKKINKKEYIANKNDKIPNIKLAKLGNEAGVIGSILL